MTVYIVETGCYEQRGVAGVYASVEAAMAAHPIPADYKFPAKPSAYNHSRPTGWTQHEWAHSGQTFVRWSNGLDWDDAADITPYEVNT